MKRKKKVTFQPQNIITILPDVTRNAQGIKTVYGT